MQHPQARPRGRFRFLAALACVAALATSASAIVRYDDTNRPAAPPPPGPLLDAWNLQGDFGGFLGTPISRDLFITAQHIDSPGADHLSGRTFVFDGVSYTTVDSYNVPGTDLRIHRVGAGSFSRHATLYDASASGTEVGRSFIAIGRGRQRGAVFDGPGGASDPRGWYWGAVDGVRSYGTSDVNAIVNFDDQSATDTNYGDLVAFDFAGAGDVTLSEGDSGGALFVIVNGQPQLAGIHFGVEAGPFSTTAGGPYAVASIYDARGLFIGSQMDHELIDPTATQPISASGYSSRIASHLSEINGIVAATVPEPTTLATLAVAALTLIARRRR